MRSVLGKKQIFLVIFGSRIGYFGASSGPRPPHGKQALRHALALDDILLIKHSAETESA